MTTTKNWGGGMPKIAHFHVFIVFESNLQIIASNKITEIHCKHRGKYMINKILNNWRAVIFFVFLLNSSGNDVHVKNVKNCNFPCFQYFESNLKKKCI